MSLSAPALPATPVRPLLASCIALVLAQPGLALVRVDQKLLVAPAALSREQGALRKEQGHAEGLACLGALARATANRSVDLLRLGLSQGLSLPFDAGKYETCLDLPHTRYFLTAAQGTLPAEFRPAGPAKPLKMSVGLCLPEACSKRDVEVVVKTYVPKLVSAVGLPRISLANVTATSPQLDLKSPRTSTFAALAVLGLLAFLVIWATVLQLRSEQPAEAAAEGAPARPQRTPALLAAFSAVGPSGTWVKLWECPPRGSLDCLNGMRAMSMFWVVLGHSFLYVTDVTGSFANVQDIFKNQMNTDAIERHPPSLMLIINGQVVVDTFLLISGILQAVQTLELFEGGKGTRNFFWMGIAQRYCRLTPSVALVYLSYHMILPYLARGPFAPGLQEHILSRCDETWWATFLYVQAFYPFNRDRMCMKWTWYLSCDMLYFIVGMAILPFYASRKWLVVSAVLAMMAGSLAVGTVMSNAYPLELDPSWVHSTGWGLVYINPLIRAVPYLVGLLTGFLQHHINRRAQAEEKGSQPSGSRLPSLAAWAAFLVALGGMAFIVMFPQTNLGDHKGSWKLWQVTAYTIYSRPVWAACCATIALLCCNGHVRVVDALLSHRFWIPLARLTYGAYLIHPLAIKLAAGRSLQFYTFSFWEYIYHYFGNLSLAYFGSALLWMLAERPVVTLAGLVLARPPKKAAGEAAPAAAAGEAGSEASAKAGSGPKAV